MKPVLSAVMVGLAALALADARVGRPERPRTEPERADLELLDWPARIALERHAAESDPAHQPRIQSGLPMLGEHARFDGTGARITVGQTHETGVTVGLGEGPHQPRPASPTPSRHRGRAARAAGTAP